MSVINTNVLRPGVKANTSNAKAMVVEDVCAASTEPPMGP